jgi:CubicO group peptidase (beta-lactamase class C family)
MRQYQVPGITLSITKNGRLIFTRAYGYADRETQRVMQPDSRGRIGSISKTITSVAILHLVEQGELDLDTPFLQILTQYSVPPGGDERIGTITVRQLLHHTGGWDTSISGDPEMQATEIANALGATDPSNCGDWIQYKVARP